jgi:hypothetical protein
MIGWISIRTSRKIRMVHRSGCARRTGIPILDRCTIMVLFASVCPRHSSMMPDHITVQAIPKGSMAATGHDQPLRMSASGACGAGTVCQISTIRSTLSSCLTWSSLPLASAAGDCGAGHWLIKFLERGRLRVARATLGRGAEAGATVARENQTNPRNQPRSMT